MTKTLAPWKLAWMKACRTRDPLAFVTGVLGVELHDPARPNDTMNKWQQTALEKLRDGKSRLSIRSGHGVGKTAFLAWIALFALLCCGPDTKVPIAAGSQSQLRDTIQPEIGKWAAKLPPELACQINVGLERITVVCSPEEAFAVFRTASKNNPQALAGFHAKNIWFLVDESSAVADIAFEVMQGALSSPGAVAILTGNPTKSSGYFFDTHTKLRGSWQSMVVSSEDVERARGHIEDVIAAYGKNSNRYRVRVLGEFPTHDDQAVISLDLIERACGRDITISDVWPIWGVDVGRFGDDPSALAKRQGNSLKYDDGRSPLFEWKGMDGAQIAGRIQAEYRATAIVHRPREIIVDVIGVGASVYDILRLDGSEVREITTGANVSELPARSETDHRLRDELWFASQHFFAELKCHFPKRGSLPNEEDNKLLEQLIAELSTPTYDFNHAGKHVVESKKDLKKRNVPSPNIADAWNLTNAGGVYPRTLAHRRPEYDAPVSWRAA